MKNNTKPDRPRSQPGIEQSRAKQAKPCSKQLSDPASQLASQAASQPPVVAKELAWNRASRNRRLQACQVRVPSFKRSNSICKSVEHLSSGHRCWAAAKAAACRVPSRNAMLSIKNNVILFMKMKVLVPNTKV